MEDPVKQDDHVLDVHDGFITLDELFQRAAERQREEIDNG